MIRTFPDPALVTRAIRVSIEELTGIDPGLESSGYVEGSSERARQEQLMAVAARSTLLELPGRFEVNPAPVVKTEGGVKYVPGTPYAMLREWRDRVRFLSDKTESFLKINVSEPRSC